MTQSWQASSQDKEDEFIGYDSRPHICLKKRKIRVPKCYPSSSRFEDELPSCPVETTEPSGPVTTILERDVNLVTPRDHVNIASHLISFDSIL
jgi:hypothetical protein